jgi:hypothetical protein
MKPKYKSKIHCLVVTKNEEDVIALCLNEATRWADYIYVYDGVSSDKTWDIVKSLNNPRIIPWKQDGKVFCEGLRAEIFNEFRHLSDEGDWWLQLNADEFYDLDPGEFFSGIPRGNDFVWGINMEYKITEKDIATIDFSKPFEQVKPLLKYYECNWSEPRAFRYRKGMIWDENNAWPYHAGLVAEKRILYKHYPYRSPAQIQERLDVRRENRNRGFTGWEHAKDEGWESKVVDSKKCHFDDGSSVHPIIDIEKMPSHLESGSVRILKTIMHGLKIWP